MIRDVLLAPRTYYIRRDGNDNNTGLLDSAAGAFKTWAKAANVASCLDFCGQTVTLKHGTDPDTSPFTENVIVQTAIGGGSLDIVGTPGVTSFDTPTNYCFYVDRVAANVVFKGIKLVGGGDGQIDAISGSRVFIGPDMEFGQASFSHLFVHDAQSIIFALNSQYSISGSASYHLFVTGGAAYIEASAVALANGLAFPGGFVCAMNGGMIQSVQTLFTGPAPSGPRYTARGNGVIDTYGAGLSYFPGSVDGAVSAGGQYI